MLAAIKQCQGKVMLSGYPNSLYDGELAGWDSEISKSTTRFRVER